jgi:gluconolactonase
MPLFGPIGKDAIMSWFPEPRTIETVLHTEMPAAFRTPVERWSRRKRDGQLLDSFLEGPCFGPDGTLFVVDIAHGRVFAISPAGAWRVVVQYDGEPNGLALHPDGRLIIADYKNGLLALDPASGAVTPFLTRRNDERFKGVNDLVFARNGDLYFTDQGQTGLHDPTGRVFRLRPDGRLDCLIDNGPSPNGLVLSPDEDVLFVAMTRDNAVWRVPLMRDGGTTKVGRFASFHGTSGPDGLAMDRAGNLLVAHASLGAVFVLGPQGEPLARMLSCRGRIVTNLTFGGAGLDRVFITESETGSVLSAEWNAVAG